MKKIFGLVVWLVFITMVFSATANATSCLNWPRFFSTEDYLEPLSIDVSQVGSFFSTYVHSEGIQFASEMRGNELWVDITKYPGTTTAAGALRAIMQMGRLVSDDFDTLVLADDGVGLFAISEPKLRDIGCQFIWGRKGGQNPIALMRDLFQGMEYYETRQPLSTRWNGSLLGDSNLAVTLNNEVLVPEWVLNSVK